MDQRRSNGSGCGTLSALTVHARNLHFVSWAGWSRTSASCGESSGKPRVPRSSKTSYLSERPRSENLSQRRTGVCFRDASWKLSGMCWSILMSRKRERFNGTRATVLLYPSPISLKTFPTQFIFNHVGRKIPVTPSRMVLLPLQTSGRHSSRMPLSRSSHFLRISGLPVCRHPNMKDPVRTTATSWIHFRQNGYETIFERVAD